MAPLFSVISHYAIASWLSRQDYAEASVDYFAAFQRHLRHEPSLLRFHAASHYLLAAFNISPRQILLRLLHIY